MQKIGIICDKIVANLADNSSNQVYLDVKNNISPDRFGQISEIDQETDFSHFKQSNIQVTQQKDAAEVPAFTEDTVLRPTLDSISLSTPLATSISSFPISATTSLPSFISAGKTCTSSPPHPSFSPVPSATAPSPSLPSLASALPSYAALSTLAFTGASIINMPTCLLEHIIHTNTLSPLEKLYYIVADSLCMINLNKKNNRSIAMPSHKWARLISCSRTKVFALQSSLEAKGYFSVIRSSNRKGQSMRNTVITDIPSSVFEKLCLAKNREEKKREYGNMEGKGKEYEDREDDILGTAGTSNSVSALASMDSFNPAFESKREYLSRTKLFIKINYHLMKSVFSIFSLPSLAKVLWLELYTKSYIKYRSVINRTSVTSNESCASLSNSFSSQENYNLQKDLLVSQRDHASLKDLLVPQENCIFYNNPLILKKTLTVAISYKELEQKNVLSKSRVSRALSELVEHELLMKDQFYIRNNTEDTLENNRQDKSLWFCTLLLPSSIKEEIEINTKSLYFKNPQNLTYNKTPSTIALYDPPISNTKPLYNRNYILKKIDQEKSNFLKKIFKVSRAKAGVLVRPYAKVDFAGIELSQTKQSIELKRNTKNGAGLNHITENLKQGNELIQNSQITEQNVRLNHTAQDIELNNIEPKHVFQTKLGSSIENPTTATYLNLKNLIFQNQKHPLSYFYPLLEEDAIYLRKSSSRDFSLNFINKLLLRLSLKYPDHGFYTKQILLSYLIKVLKHELRQAPIVNNESFDFKPIKGSKEDENKRIEKYLNALEQCTKTDFRSQIKRRIIGLSSGNDEYAYHILTNLRLPYIDSSEIKHLSIADLLQNFEDSNTTEKDTDTGNEIWNKTFKTLEIKISNEINERQKLILIKAINEVLSYSVDISFKIMETSYFKFEAEATNNIVTNHSDATQKSLGQLERLNQPNPSNPSSPLWQKIRHILIKRYGEAIDISWFSKLDIEVKEGGKQINIIAPNAFIQLWIKNNYQSSIENAIEILKEQEPQGIYEQCGGLIEQVNIVNLHQGLKGALNILCIN